MSTGNHLNIARNGGKTVDISLKRVDYQNYYEILEVSPHATDEEIQHAFERLATAYSATSPGIHALFPPEDIKVIRAKIEEAYQVLSNPRRRQHYDLMLRGEAPPETASPARPDHRQRRLSPEELHQVLGPDHPAYSGGSLRTIREFLSLDEKEIAQEIKLRRGMLRAIEEEDVAALPAPVYLKGFIKAYAKCLGLDPERVVHDYLEGIVRQGYSTG